MKNVLSNLFLGIIFLIGLGILLYPTVSNIVNTHYSDESIADYESTVSNMSKLDYSNYIKSARAYNERLKNGEIPTEDEYNSELNIGGSNIMAYIEIPKIDVKLPVYHSVSDGVLQKGIGHLPETSLPVGGEGTHCVLSGHRGLPSAKLFTRLDEMEIGDTFNIYVLDERLSYKVDDIRVVEPQEVSSLGFYPGKDYVTLVTCTPYAVNTHRLLVRGVRVVFQEPKAKVYDAEAVLIDPNLIAVIAMGTIWTILFIIGLIYINRKKITQKSERSENDEKQGN